LQFDEFEKAMI